MPTFMRPRDVALFLHSARTDARLQRLRTSLGSMSAALEAIYADDPDPWSSASSEYLYQRRKYDVLTTLLPTGRFANALDLGCGPGLLASRLTERAERVTGIDISPTAIRLARARHAGNPRARFETLDLWTLPRTFDAAFDLVVVADVLYYVTPLDDGVLDDIVIRIAALLQPGGTCLLANHYVVRFDRDSRRSARIHDAFRRSNLFRVTTEARRPFYLVTVLYRTGQEAVVNDAGSAV